MNIRLNRLLNLMFRWIIYLHMVLASDWIRCHLWLSNIKKHASWQVCFNCSHERYFLRNQPDGDVCRFTFFATQLRIEMLLNEAECVSNDCRLWLVHKALFDFTVFALNRHPMWVTIWRRKCLNSTANGGKHSFFMIDYLLYNKMRLNSSRVFIEELSLRVSRINYHSRQIKTKLIFTRFRNGKHLNFWIHVTLWRMPT